MTKYIQVITTVDKERVAQNIAKLLLNNRLAACIQIFPIKSLYWWNNKIQNSKEFICLIKGKDFKKIEKVIKKIHPYKVPEIIATNISKCNKDYLNWLKKEVK